MEDIFNIDGILSPEEAEKLFEEKVEDPEEQPEETEEKQPAEEPEEEESPEEPEEVGEEEKEEGKDAIGSEGDGSSPIYSSIAKALKNDGIFPDIDDSELEGIKTPEDFAELFEKAIETRFDERTKRIDAALANGVPADTVQKYEQTIQYLESITEDQLSAEGDEGENLRRQLIYNDLINKGNTEEKAKRELEKSFKYGSDVDDAKDALDALKQYYSDGYTEVQNKAKKQAEEAKARQKKQADDFKKMILDDEVKLGESVLDKKTKQRVFDAVSKPVYKDPETGQLLTAVQKYQKENPLEFLKQLGLWFVMTDGGKNMNGFTKAQLRAEKNAAIKELGRKINTSSLNKDGSLRYTSGGAGDGDGLLSDGWQIGW